MNLSKGFKKLIRNGKKFIKRNDTKILAVGVAGGIILSNYLSAKAAVKCKDILDNDPESSETVTADDGTEVVIPKKLPVKTKLKKTWKTLLPPAITTGITIGGVFFLEHIGRQKWLSAMALASMWKKHYVDLEHATYEKLGATKFIEMQDERLKKKVAKDPPPNVPLEPGKLWFYEPYTEQYIQASKERVAWAQNVCNRELIHDFAVTLDRFVTLLGGKSTEVGKMLGWSYDSDSMQYACGYYGPGAPWIEIQPTLEEYNTGREFLYILYELEPIDLTDEDDKIYRD
jgi:hypothetical protein